MNEALGFTEATYGLGTGLFFIGYFFLGIPGALIVERWGARRLIGCTAIAWGVATCLFATVKTPAEFYAFRLLLGLSAAAFFPGVIVYLSQWFPERDRSRALAAFIIAAADIAHAGRAPLGIDSSHALDLDERLAMDLHSGGSANHMPGDGCVLRAEGFAERCGAAGGERARSFSSGDIEAVVEGSSRAQRNPAVRSARLREYRWIRIHLLAARAR